MKKGGYLLKASAAWIAAMLLVIGAVSLPRSAMAAETDQRDKSITGLGTGAIRNPRVPEEDEAEADWQGSYVYFGKFDADGDGTAEPVKYRVLDIDSNDFDVPGRSLLLDCDTILYKTYFSSEKYDSEWNGSNVQRSLNTGDDSFLGKPGNFTEAEKNAIAESYKSELTEEEEAGEIEDFYFAELEGDKVFLLDVVEVTRPSYGYLLDSNGSYSRIKADEGYWWLRSYFYYLDDDLFFIDPAVVLNTDIYPAYEFIIDAGTVFSGGTGTDYRYGVSPALKIR